MEYLNKETPIVECRGKTIRVGHNVYLANGNISASITQQFQQTHFNLNCRRDTNVLCRFVGGAILDSY